MVVLVYHAGRVANGDRWRERVIERTGEKAHFHTFSEFVRTPPLEGLGASLDLLRRICANEPRVLDLLDQATQQPVGVNQHTVLVDNINTQDGGRPDGTSSTAALRRLRKDCPDLHARVLDGELTPHAAAIEAGFRRCTVQVPLDPPHQLRVSRRGTSNTAL